MGAHAKGTSSVRVVVCDTGPILHLREAGALELLAHAGEVIVPPAVDRELETQISNWSNSRPTWVRIVPVSDEDARQAEQWRTIGGLGLGEEEEVHGLSQDLGLRGWEGGV